MALPLYLAMTAGEILKNPHLPDKLGYMACHFSPYGTGLSNIPKTLPEDSLLILNDRTPIHGHDPELIMVQLTEILESNRCHGLLLDFQRPDYPESVALASYLSQALPCPVAVSQRYAAELSCPVFLDALPPDTALITHLAPWQGREIWLEAALDKLLLTLTSVGCQRSSLPFSPNPGICDEGLHIHYQIDIAPEETRFTLCRSREDLEELLEEAEFLGVTLAVGLWQDLK